MPTSKNRSGKCCWNGIKPGRAGHRGGDGDDARVELGGLDDRLGERLGVAGGHGLGRSVLGVEHRCVVEVLLVVVLGRRVAASLLGEDVDDDRPLGGEHLGAAERLFELGDVVAVDRAGVAHAERLEERRRLEELAHAGLERLDRPLGVRADAGEVLQEVFEPALAAHVDRVEADVGERVRELAGHTVGEARMGRRVRRWPCELAHRFDTVGA